MKNIDTTDRLAHLEKVLPHNGISTVCTLTSEKLVDGFTLDLYEMITSSETVNDWLCYGDGYVNYFQSLPRNDSEADIVFRDHDGYMLLKLSVFNLISEMISYGKSLESKHPDINSEVELDTMDKYCQKIKAYRETYLLNHHVTSENLWTDEQKSQYRQLWSVVAIPL